MCTPCLRGRFVLFRKAVIGLLIASCSLGSFPAGVGAYQAARACDKIEAALAGYSLAQADMKARMERANTEVEASAEVVAGADAWTPSPLASDLGREGGGIPRLYRMSLQ